jgi:hypothetical protein
MDPNSGRSGKWEASKQLMVLRRLVGPGRRFSNFLGRLGWSNGESLGRFYQIGYRTSRVVMRPQHTIFDL